ncbi:Major facilitator superfamily [Fusarium oxysporum f. sp. vasinfectum]|nr:Major facilitator superfamily [Fusarium oxysporum f. sp. vasinfectum]
MASDREDQKPTIDDQYPDHLVTFDGSDDPYNPMNWPFRKKFITTISYGLTTCWITLASAIFAAAIEPVSTEFNVNTETSAAATSLLVFGFGLGPLVWGPLSELYGRKWLILIPYFIAAIFAFGTATAKDIQTVLITRFFSGLFGSAPVTITGGVMADIWAPHQLGNAIVAYGVTIVGGPTLGPIIGGALCSNRLGWRWTEYLTGIVMMAQLAVDLLVIDESYAPILLARKAHKLRLQTQDWALHAKHEEWDVSFKELYQKYFIRPFQMMATPICLLMSLYASFVYGILYANLESFSIEYQEVRQWGPVVGTLPFITLLIGILCAAAVNIYNNKYYRRKLMENGYRAVPEARLPPMMLGGIVFTAGQFLFAWTSSPSVNYWPSIIGIALTGLGFTTIFQAALGYLIDTFTRYSASAVAANTFMRSMFSGAFPLFIIPMYHKLGVDWGITVFGCIAAALIPSSGSASVVRAGNTPDYSGYNTLSLIRRTPARPGRQPKDSKQKNSTSLDTSWVNAILFAYTGEQELGSKQGNSSVSASIEITCATCYIKGTATTEFIYDREFNVSRAFSNFTNQVRRGIDSLADETADYIEKYIDKVADNLEDGFDMDDFDLPPLDYNLNIDIPEIPEFRLQFQFDGLEVYMLIDTVLSAGATYTLNLYTSTTPAGFAVRDNLEVGVIFAIDLILSVEGEINISSGFHLRLDDGVLFDIAIFSKEISNLTINGGDFEFLPVTLESAGVVFKAVLRVGVKAGFEIASPEVSIAGKTIFHVGGGVEVGVFANIAELITNVTLSTDEDNDCSLRVEEVYQLAVGAAAGASVAIDDITWGPMPETEIPVFYTTLGHACASQRSSDASLSITTSPALETTSKYTTTRTHVTVVPTDSEADFPESVIHTVTSLIPFGNGANKLVAMSGVPSSYIPPTTTPSARENGKDDDSNGTSNERSSGVSKSVIIGVSVGLGVPFLLGGIAVIW